MTDDKSRNRPRISIDGAGIERRRTAIQALVDQAPPRPDPAPRPFTGAGQDGVEAPRPPAPPFPFREG
ncbi:hypothetical protein [Nonomuraea zeae]|uniref:Uncharacterized protein n=1 Tax=Nonomuraea zeae TaxID=1642303 RepID=A0A5S4G5K4_9ACTN|nr:hypothetical protein [Nonomuraea zeae]TMR28278.1 hypothetical protein ETD85_36285 [Nonomuraea zeae]